MNPVMRDTFAHKMSPNQSAASVSPMNLKGRRFAPGSDEGAKKKAMTRSQIVSPWSQAGGIPAPGTRGPARKRWLSRRCGPHGHPFAPGPGFSLIEVLVVIAIAAVLAAYAIPRVDKAVQAYRFNAAVEACTGIIQSTRYQAIMRGYPYALAFDPATLTYQVSNQPAGATGFTAVGGPVPFANPGELTLSQATTLQFGPNGTVQATTGTMSFQLVSSLKTKTITISGVGNVSVSP